MIKMLDEALMAWQAALVGRGLYDPDHPSVQSSLDHAHRLISKILETTERIRVLAVEDRLVCGKETLPSGGQLLRELFGRLVKRQITSVILERGLTRAELRDLAAGLEGPDETEPVSSTAHIRLGHIQEVAAGPGEAALADAGRSRGAVHMGGLQRLWSQIAQHGDCPVDPLVQMVTELSASAALASGMLLPLASLKTHDEYTFTHTINVALMSSALGEAAGLMSDVLFDLTGAALLHDLGKQATPKQLLNKAGKLTEPELRIVQQHPIIGAAMLIGMPNVPRLAPIVAFEHHMALDGGGYPRVAGGWRPSVASQIVQIADIFDALRTNRPYRDAMSLEKSLEIMSDLAGGHFDKDLWQLFLDRVVGRARRLGISRHDPRRAAPDLPGRAARHAGGGGEVPRAADPVAA